MPRALITARERNRRSHRQIDTATDDDDRHSNRTDGDDHGLRQDRAQISQGKIFFRLANQDRKDDNHEQQAEERCEPIKPVSRDRRICERPISLCLSDHGFWFQVSGSKFQVSSSNSSVDVLSSLLLTHRLPLIANRGWRT
jgi:hypothetical protein